MGKIHPIVELLQLLGLANDWSSSDFEPLEDPQDLRLSNVEFGIILFFLLVIPCNNKTPYKYRFSFHLLDTLESIEFIESLIEVQKSKIEFHLEMVTFERE